MGRNDAWPQSFLSPRQVLARDIFANARSRMEPFPSRCLRRNSKKALAAAPTVGALAKKLGAAAPMLFAGCLLSY